MKPPPRNFSPRSSAPRLSSAEPPSRSPTATNGRLSHAAAAVGNAEAVSRLLAVGASPALRTATGADVVKIACDARQTEVVGVLRRHAAGVAGVRRKRRPPPPPDAERIAPPARCRDPTPTSEAPPSEAPPPAAPPAPEPLFAVGARVEARGSKVETSGTPA